MSIEQSSKCVNKFCQKIKNSRKYYLFLYSFFRGYGRLVLEVEIMNGLIEFLTTEEMIVVYVLLGIASVLGLIVYFLDKTHNKRRQRQNTRELRKIVDEVAPSNSGEILTRMLSLF